MPPTDRIVQDRLGQVIFRLTSIERRLQAAPASPRLAARLTQDVRKLSQELEACYQDAGAVLAECARLKEADRRSRARAAFYFDHLNTPALVVEPSGAILDANMASARLLNVSCRHLAGRDFHLYLASDREQFLKRLAALPEAPQAEHWEATLRPRERSALEVQLTAALDPEGRILISIRRRDGGKASPRPLAHDHGLELIAG